MTSSQQSIYDVFVSFDFNAKNDNQLSSRNVKFFDVWKTTISNLFEHQRYLKWLNNFEFHEVIHNKNQDFDTVVKQKYNYKIHYIIMYENVQMHDDENRYLNLNRIKNEYKSNEITFSAIIDDEIFIKQKLEIKFSFKLDEINNQKKRKRF